MMNAKTLKLLVYNAKIDIIKKKIIYVQKDWKCVNIV